MRVLGIESSSLVASVAIVTDGIFDGRIYGKFKENSFPDLASHD